MAEGKQAVSFDAIIQAGRQKRQAEKLAQEILGKGRRSSAPPTGPKAGLGGSLASRVGVTKRNPSLPRSNTPRQARGQPAHLSRPPVADNHRPRPSYTQSFSGPVSDAKSSGYATDEAANGSGGISFKGAASGPYTVIAQNFASGTTAADIESVMQNVGGNMTSCKLVASKPTVMAEMVFVERSGAEKVIDTFNGKKADGRPLYVYWKTGGSSSAPRINTQSQPPDRHATEPQTPALGAGQAEDDVMMVEVDENAESRQAQDRLREERRGRDGGDSDRVRREVMPSGPKNFRTETDGYYDPRPAPRRAQPNYSDGRYGFGGGRGGGAGGYRDGGYRDGGPGRYRDGQERRFGGGTSWRP